jgi:hypothetical protein
MMDLIIETVKKLETMMKDGGCEDGGVVLDVNTDAVNCQFERGACMTASFGGRSADFVTYDPIRAKTKISFMFGTPLDTPPVRGAHTECRRQLLCELDGKKIFSIGSMPGIETAFRSTIVTNPHDADVIVMNGEGIIKQGTGTTLLNYKDTKRFLCLGPSTAGIARLNQIEHWCPFGTC